MIQKKIKALFNSDYYHGWGQSKSYFEGWYYKVISADENHAYAFIPGIAMDAKGNQQAFIQILDGKNETAEYIKFPFKSFKADPETFHTIIENNSFQKDKIQFDMNSVKGTLNFSNLFPWPNKWYSPGIMGPYAFVPFMECYHGIVSMDHSIEGKLEINNKIIDFTGGKGYTEKDWGHSFPSAYFWMQSNHFSKDKVSFKASVAKIPWLGNSFVGFIAGLYLNDELIQFTTYNSSKLIRSYADESKVEIILQNRTYLLEILAHRSKATELASPLSGLMDGRISESMTCTIDIKLTDRRNNKVVFEDRGNNAALEVAGAIKEIIIDNK